MNPVGAKMLKHTMGYILEQGDAMRQWGLPETGKTIAGLAFGIGIHNGR